MIIVKEVKKVFDNGLTIALNGVSFEVEMGELVAITGPSGCGKSTLLNIIGTLETPTSGKVLIEGEDIFRFHPIHDFRAKTIGFVFQFHYLIPTMTLVENVELPMYSLNIPKRERREKALELLDSMSLSNRANFFPTKVSGGERQRAAIARALANDPRIILADEPTGNLDVDTGKMVMDYLLSLCKEKSITLLIATHNPSIASQAGRIIYMKNGRVEMPLD